MIEAMGERLLSIFHCSSTIFQFFIFPFFPAEHRPPMADEKWEMENDK
ncbi:MAG: hypothetical protein ACKVX9_15305 [Blastocatellia bacterium]